MKKLLSILLVLMMAITLVACSNKEDELDAQSENEIAEEEFNSSDKAWLKSKTGKFYSKFKNGMYMEYEMEFEGQKMNIKSASLGDKTYSETIIGGVSSGASIIDGDYMYSIDHSSKTVFKMALNMSSTQIVDTMIEEGDIDASTIVKGTREVEGKTYETEEFEVEGAKTILCFDKDEVKYMIASIDEIEVLIKVIKTDNKVDEKLFDIPADYNLMPL